MIGWGAYVLGAEIRRENADSRNRISREIQQRMTSEQAANAEEYGAGAIQVLEGLEAVRKLSLIHI